MIDDYVIPAIFLIAISLILIFWTIRREISLTSQLIALRITYDQFMIDLSRVSRCKNETISKVERQRRDENLVDASRDMKEYMAKILRLRNNLPSKQLLRKTLNSICINNGYYDVINTKLKYRQKRRLGKY